MGQSSSATKTANSSASRTGNKPSGTVEAIFVAPTKGAPMSSVREVQAVAGKGLEGDRYYLGKGSFSRWPAPHREVTLIAIEGLEEMHRELGITLAPEATRRNILTRGIELSDLLKQTFTVGAVRMQGIRRCQPCKYLVRLTGEPRLLPGMVDRGGLRARILTDGFIRIGDRIKPVDD